MQPLLRALCICTFTLFLSISVFGQWTLLSAGTGQDFESVQIVDNNTIYRQEVPAQYAVPVSG